MDPSKLQSVWATPDAPARSIGQARRRHRSRLTNEEPPSKKAKVNRRDKNEETKQADSKKTESQSTSQALVPRFAANVSQNQLPDFAFLPTHPSPALDFHAYQTRDQYFMRYPAQGWADNEGAPSGFNEFLARLYLPYSNKGPQSENGQTGFDMCLESLASQEGISAIKYQTQSKRKLAALTIAYDLFNRRIDDKNTARILAKATSYWSTAMDRNSRPWERPKVAGSQSENGQTVFDMCFESVASQGGISAINYQIQSKRKKVTVISQFGLLNRRIDDENTLSRMLAKATSYLSTARIRSSRPWERPKVAAVSIKIKNLVISISERGKMKVLKMDADTVEQEFRKSPEYVRSTLDKKAFHEFCVFAVTYLGLTRDVRAWESKNPGAIKQFGEVFWKQVGAMMPKIPEVDNFDTQVGLMCVMLFDVQFLYLQSMGEGPFDELIKDPVFRCFLWSVLASGD